MDAEFDVTKLAAQFAQQNAEKFVGLAASGVKGLATHVRARLKGTYRSYLERLLERYGRGKSFFVRSESIPLYDFFVPLDLTTQVRQLSAPSITNVAEISPFAIITGSGGSGKSMMMRHLLVSCIAAKQKTPIFLELRQLNQTTHTIIEALIETLQSFGLTVDPDFFEAALESGQLALLLDGFDELEHSSRKRISAEIQALARRYPNIWLIMSSRPDSALQGWEAFAEYSVAPLTLEKADLLVQKLPFDEQLKESFIRDMREVLFVEHESFLSNPLLLSIMLLTYGDVAHIPHKLSTFYSQAYEALFHRHDALKSGYQRERRSGLDIQDYSRAFAAFSVLSYDQREFSFTSERALELIAAARDASMLKYDDNAFLNDAIQAVCLLLEEGLEITFAHRSFQEYFVARFIQLSPPEVKAKLVERFVPSVESDSVMSLLWELDPYVVEKHYLLPRLAEFREIMGAVASVKFSHLHRYITSFYTTFHVDDDNVVSATIGNIELFRACSFAYRYYRGWKNLLPEEEAIWRKTVYEAFVAEFGSVSEMPVTRLKVRGPFVRALAPLWGSWGIEYLEALLEIEREITAKHETNRESLQRLLSAPGV
jgi:hypothetical protein